MQQMRGKLRGYEDGINGESNIEQVGDDEHDEALNVIGQLSRLRGMCGHLLQLLQIQIGRLHVVNDHAEAKKEQYVRYRVKYYEPGVHFAVEHADHVYQDAKCQEQEHFL